MNEEFVYKRLLQLRLDKDLSARDMSLSLGQGENYINQIDAKLHLPSWPMFFEICNFFHITPSQFFDIDLEHPIQLQELMDVAKKLDAKDLATLKDVATSLSEKYSR